MENLFNEYLEIKRENESLRINLQVKEEGLKHYNTGSRQFNILLRQIEEYQERLEENNMRYRNFVNEHISVCFDCGGEFFNIDAYQHEC